MGAVIIWLFSEFLTKGGIIYEKIEMQEGDDEGMINYEWPYK